MEDGWRLLGWLGEIIGVHDCRFRRGGIRCIAHLARGLEMFHCMFGIIGGWTTQCRIAAAVATDESFGHSMADTLFAHSHGTHLQRESHTDPRALQVNIPKTRRTYCKGKDCKKHTQHKVTQYKAGKVRYTKQKLRPANPRD